MQDADSPSESPAIRSGCYDEIAKIETLRREQRDRIRARTRAIRLQEKPAKAESLPFVRRSTARR